MLLLSISFIFFFFNDTATTEIYTLSLHDALPICDRLAHPAPLLHQLVHRPQLAGRIGRVPRFEVLEPSAVRSEEHTSELQSLAYLVCRLLLEKKKKKNNYHNTVQQICPSIIAAIA